jgi:hypothetical protein
MQRLRTLPIPLKLVAYAAAAAALLGVAAGVGAMAALMLDAGSPEGTKTERVGEVHPEQGGKPETAEKAASDGPSEGAYLDGIASIQERSVEASLRSNEKLLRYDALNADDVEEMKSDYVALRSYARGPRISLLLRSIRTNTKYSFSP